MLNKDQDKVDLKWVTASEINTSHFVVERSFDGSNFADAALVFANGSASEKASYSFVDNIAARQKPVIYYRLRSVDNDSKSQLSETRIIRVGRNGESLRMITYPNPVASEMRITMPSGWQGKPVALTLYNEQGQRMKGFNTFSASQTETMEVSELRKGFYVLKASCGAETLQQKIIKQ
jgi:hypothetical protein